MNQLSSKSTLFSRLKPFIAVIFLQFGIAGMDIISKVALNEGMSNYVFVVYRHAIATIVMAPFAIVLDKKTRPKMTLPTFFKIVMLSLLELEKVKLQRFHGQAKVIGTFATVAGAMIMTLVRGPIIKLPWTNKITNPSHSNGIDLQHSIKGAILITVGCFSWASFVILQAITLETYPVELSLTAWICLLGTAEGVVVALVMERNNYAAWSINLDTKLLAAVYSGILCSGLAYYVQGLIMRDRGPVFVTAFNPLAMVIVAVMSSFIMREKMLLGRVLGAVIIVTGLYLVVWGKSKDYKSSSDERGLSDSQIVLANDKIRDHDFHECNQTPSTHL